MMIISLYASSALLSFVLINLVPMYAKSAPICFAEAISRPLEIQPERSIVLLKNFLTSAIKGIGFSVPPCPPAPAATKIKPSTPASAAFSACLFLMTS